MAFEPNYEKVVSSYRRKLGVTQTMVDCKLPTDEGITKLLCTSAKSHINSSEIEGNTINYLGCVSFQVIYTNQNNEVVGTDYTVEFKEKFTYGEELNGVSATTCDVIDVNSVVNNGELKIVATLELNNEIITNNAQVVLVGANDLLTQKENISFNSYCDKVAETFEVMQDYEIKDGVSKILTVCSNPYLTKITPNTNYFVAEGGVNVDISYLTDNNVLRTTQTNFKFTQEISADCVNELSTIQSDLSVACNQVKITTNIDVDSAIVNLNIPLTFVGYVFNKSNLEVVSDAFSLTNYVNVTSESLTTFESYNSYHFEERINGSLTIDDDMPMIDQVLGTCCNHIVLANTLVENGVFTVEGIAYTTVLYQNNELNNINSVVIEMPFSISNNIDYEQDDIMPLIQLSLGEVNARVRRNKELEVSADLHIYADFYKNYDEVVISKITIDDEIPYDECALSIYITKQGDTLWDIAKEMRVSPETILQQNPNLSDEIAPLTRVVIYRQKVQEF